MDMLILKRVQRLRNLRYLSIHEISMLSLNYLSQWIISYFLLVFRLLHEEWPWRIVGRSAVFVLKYSLSIHPFLIHLITRVNFLRGLNHMWFRSLVEVWIDNRCWFRRLFFQYLLIFLRCKFLSGICLLIFRYGLCHTFKSLSCCCWWLLFIWLLRLLNPLPLIRSFLGWILFLFLGSAIFFIFLV